MRSFAPGKLRAHLSSRVGACGRRPLESADPGLGVAVDVGKPLVEEGKFADPPGRLRLLAGRSSVLA